MRKAYASMPDNETYFFQTLNTIVGGNLKAKTIGLKISSGDVFLDKDFRKYNFRDDIESMLLLILKELQSTGSVGIGSLSHHVDGLFVDHPKFGSRIIEFDEEQHFNTFRAVTLRHVSSQVKSKYLSHFQECCGDAEYFNRMLSKHQLKTTVKSVPETVDSFIELVQRNARPNYGYIEPKTGFDYIGGRIAQRAYYDSLRDLAHLSPMNSSFALPLRFSMFEFEKESGRRFDLIPRDKLRSMIERRLNFLA